MGGAVLGRERGAPSPGTCSHYPLFIFLGHDVDDVQGNAVEGVRVDHGRQEGQEGTDHGGGDDQADVLGPGERRDQPWGGGWGVFLWGLGRAIGCSCRKDG